MSIISLFRLLLIFFSFSLQASSFTIMLDPAGNTRNPGRLIDNMYEHVITLTCAQELKKEIESALPQTSVIITRTPGQPTSTTNYAQRANTRDIALFLSLNFYPETDTKPHIYLYQFLYNTQEALTKPAAFTFYKEEQSYLFNHASSEHVAHIIQKTCNKKMYAQHFTTHGVIGCPCAALKGIIAPALVLDMGIKKHTDWHQFIAPLVESIGALLQASTRAPVQTPVNV